MDGDLTVAGAISARGGDAADAGGTGGLGGMIYLFSDNNHNAVDVGKGNLLIAETGKLDASGGDGTIGGSARNDGIAGEVAPFPEEQEKFAIFLNCDGQHGETRNWMQNSGILIARGGVHGGSGGDIIYHGIGPGQREMDAPGAATTIRRGETRTWPATAAGSRATTARSDDAAARPRTHVALDRGRARVRHLRPSDAAGEEAREKVAPRLACGPEPGVRARLSRVQRQRRGRSGRGAGVVRRVLRRLPRGRVHGLSDRSMTASRSSVRICRGSRSAVRRRSRSITTAGRPRPTSASTRTRRPTTASPSSTTS